MRRTRLGSGKARSRLSLGGVRDKDLSFESSEFALLHKKHLVARMCIGRRKVYICCRAKVGLFTEMLPELVFQVLRAVLISYSQNSLVYQSSPGSVFSTCKYSGSWGT